MLSLCRLAGGHASLFGCVYFYLDKEREQERKRRARETRREKETRRGKTGKNR